jgi:CBS domain-containing protein
MKEEVKPGEQLIEIARRLQLGESASVTTVRSFLTWFFGAQRRGHWIVSYIRRALKEAGLRTEPDFESAYLDAEMQFVLTKERSSAQSITVEVVETITVSDHAEVRVLNAAFADPTYRVSKLAAANRRPIAVQPDSTLSEAVTVMMANDFSQLPVITNERTVKGIVSWRSIGSRLALGQKLVAVREAMEPHAEISFDASLFTAIPLIVEHQHVLVRSLDQRITGIVTTSDLSLQFQQLAEPFLLLGEIENHLRRIISSHFEQTELAAVQDSNNGTRRVETAADLTFGEYKSLFEDPSRWNRIGLQINRTVFTRLLERVR